MSQIESICLNFYTLVNVQKEVKYSTDIREEECHGFHTFIDQEELSNEINRVVIKVLGKDIDITDRLTKEEIAILEKLETDEIEINENSVY
jgi:tRNA U54 and U55 pseudouridine synthase Pus10